MKLPRFIAWLSFLVAFTSHAANTEIRFFSEIAAPYYFLDEEGNAQGINVDLTRALTTELQITADVEQLPWARAVQEALTKPNRILLSTLRTKKREEQFQWLGRLHEVNACLVGLVAANHITPGSLEEAKHYRIGTIRGYGAANFLLSRGFIEDQNLILVSDTTRLWHMLNEGRIDLVVSSLDTDAYEIASIGLKPDNFHSKLAVPELDLELYVATGPKTDEKTVAWIRNALKALKQRKELKAILSKWGVD